MRALLGVCAMAAGCAVATPLAGCQTLGDALAGAAKPGVQLAGVRLASLSLDGVDLSFDLDVSNPYGVALPVAGLEYALGADGASLLSGQAGPQGSVPARSHAVITLPTRVRFADALRALSGVKPGAIVAYRADLTVTLDAPALGPVRVPISHEGELPIPAAPVVRITGVQWDELTLERAAATVTMSVKNTNSFAAGLSRVSYELALGGLQVGSGMVKGAGDLRPGASTSVTIPLSFSPADLGLAAIEMLGRGELGYSLRGGATLSTPFGELSAPISATGTTSARP